MFSKDAFNKILLDAGIKEYWATSDFNLEDKKPKGSIFLPTDDVDAVYDIDELLNPIDCDEDDFVGNVRVSWNSDIKKALNALSIVHEYTKRGV